MLYCFSPYGDVARSSSEDEIDVGDFHQKTLMSQNKSVRNGMDEGQIGINIPRDLLLKNISPITRKYLLSLNIGFGRGNANLVPDIQNFNHDVVPIIEEDPG